MKKGSSASESEKWAKMSIRKKMKDEIDAFIESGEGDSHGLTNSTHFLDTAVREALEKYTKKRFEHFNFADNLIRLIDNDKPKGTPYIEVMLKGDELICRVCEARMCIHIKEVWNHTEIRKQLKRKNLKKPSWTLV